MEVTLCSFSFLRSFVPASLHSSTKGKWCRTHLPSILLKLWRNEFQIYLGQRERTPVGVHQSACWEGQGCFCTLCSLNRPWVEHRNSPGLRNGLDHLATAPEITKGQAGALSPFVPSNGKVPLFQQEDGMWGLGAEAGKTGLQLSIWLLWDEANMVNQLWDTRRQELQWHSTRGDLCHRHLLPQAWTICALCRSANMCTSCCSMP